MGILPKLSEEEVPRPNFMLIILSAHPSKVFHLANTMHII